MEILWKQGPQPATSVEEALPDRPSNSTVRTLLRLLEERGWVTREMQDGRAIYASARDAQDEGKSAIRHVLDTFFAGSARNAFAALVDDRTRLSPEDLDELKAIIERTQRGEK